MRKLWAISVMIAFMLMSACSSNVTEPQTGSNNGLSKLNIGILKIAAVANPLVAEKEGIFEKNGLDVQQIEFRNSSDAITAQQSGEVDIILSVAGTGITAIERGFDLLVVFQNEIGGTEGPDSSSIQVLADSEMNSLSDLEGKKIAAGSLNSQQTVTAQKLIKNAGVKNIEVVELPFPSHFDALKARQVDAVVTVDPFTTQLLSSGIGKVLSWNYVESIPEQPLGAWFARRDFAEKNPDVIKKFNLSMKQSIDFMLEDEQRAKDIIAEFTGLDRQLVEEMPIPKFSYDVNVGKWQDVVDLMVDEGVLEKKQDAEKYFSELLNDYIVK